MYWNENSNGNTDEHTKININMRCIEIISERMKHGNFSQININMRCIEMVKHKKAVEHYLD